MSRPEEPLEERTNVLALVSLALGVLGFLVVPIVGSIAGIICGLRSKRSIDRSGGRETGRELAVAGVALGIIGLSVWSGLLLFGFGIDAFQSAFF